MDLPRTSTRRSVARVSVRGGCTLIPSPNRGPSGDRRQPRPAGRLLEQVQADLGHQGTALAIVLRAHICRHGSHCRRLERDLRAGQATWGRERGLHLVGFLRRAHAWPCALDVGEQEGKCRCKTLLTFSDVDGRRVHCRLANAESFSSMRFSRFSTHRSLPVLSCPVLSCSSQPSLDSK